MPNSQNSKIRLLKTLFFKLYASPECIQLYVRLDDLNEINSHNVLGLIGLDGSLRFSCPVTNSIIGA